MTRSEENPSAFAGKLAALPRKVFGDFRYLLGFVLANCLLFYATVAISQQACASKELDPKTTSVSCQRESQKSGVQTNPSKAQTETRLAVLLATKREGARL